MSLKRSNAKQRKLPVQRDAFTNAEREAVDKIIAKKFGKFAPGVQSVEKLESDGNTTVDVKDTVVTDEKGDSVLTETKTVVDGQGAHVQQATVAEASDPMLFLRLLNKLNAEPISEEKMKSFEERLARIQQKCKKPAQGTKPE
jgi:hypothetical protein